MAREPFGGEGMEFSDRLRDEAMAALFADWRDLRRAAGGLPAYRRFDPFRFTALMPSLQVFERTEDGRIRQRLTGESVSQGVGVNNKGRFLEEFVAPEHLDARRVHLDRVLDGGLPCAARGRVSLPQAATDVFKRLLLPFARDDGEPGFIISYVVFARLKDAHDLPADGAPQAIWARPEDVA